MIWFTADPHFFHANIVGYCRRPFGSVSGMNDELIKRWNASVRKRDTIYVLGDFSWNVSSDTLKDLVNSLHGKIILVPSVDHDRHILNKLIGLVMIEQPLLYLNLGSERVVLCHYPLSSWSGAHYGVYMLHGHCHGSLAPGFFPNRCDVGMDAWDYRPVTLEEVKARTEALQIKKAKGEPNSEVCLPLSNGCMEGS